MPEAELETYGSDDSRLPMSGMAAYTPGMEISGGSLGIGLGIAVGMCLGLKRKGSDRFVYNLMSDGELNEGPTWEAAMSAAHWKLDNLICLVDVNRMQADGASTSVLNFEPLGDKWRGVRLARPAGRRQRHQRAGSRLRCSARSRRAEAAHHHLRHQDGEGRALPGGARKVALHARGAARMGRGHQAAGSREGVMSKRGAWRGGAALAERARAEEDPTKPRLTTSAMIASLAAEGQRTSPAPVRAGAGRDRQVAAPISSA